MYYSLNKKEYQKYEKNFKKTYIGEKYFISKIIPGVLSCTLWGIAGGIVGYNSIDSFEVPNSAFLFFFIGGIGILETILCEIEYTRELKNYINSSEK